VFEEGEVLGHLQSAELMEASGIAVSRRNAGVLWMHNDSGDRGRLFAMDRTGPLRAVVEFPDAPSVDWEDIAIGSGPQSDVDYVYIADIGANKVRRDSFTVYRFPEPVLAEDSELQLTVDDAEPMHFRYPEGIGPDAETIMLDTSTNHFVVVTKSFTGSSNVYRSPLSTQEGPRILEHVGKIDFPKDERRGSGLCTGGDISRDGQHVLLRTYTDIFYWERAPGTPLANIFLGQPCILPMGSEPQGEAIGFAADGSGFFTVSEGEGQPIYWFGRRPLAQTSEHRTNGDRQGTQVER
jgi:hypothetical protein